MMTKQIFNPYLPQGEYIPDGEPHVFGDRIYVYGSHDSFNSYAYCANDYTVYSAPVNDLRSWTCHGVSYKKADDPANPGGKMQLWAPDIQQGAGGKFYLYYCFAFKNWISVAVSNRPEGPFAYYGRVHYPDGTDFGFREEDATPFDPAVFVDDDGRVYLYTGYAPKGILPMRCKNKLRHDGAYVLELEQDMLTIKHGPVLLAPDVHHSAGTGFEGHEFYEASSLRKFNGKYYFVYSSINGHELCYAISDRPDSGFEYGGILVSNGDIGLNGRKPEEAVYYTANNHGGIVKIGEKYYIFYHRHTNYGQTSRQGCAEALTMLPNGHFVQAEITSCGLNGGPLAGTGTYPAHILCSLCSASGCFEYPYYSIPLMRKREHPYLTQKEKDGTPGARQYIRNFRDGAVAGYKYFDLRKTTQLGITVSGNAKGSIAVLTDPDGAPVVQIPITKAAGTIWTMLSVDSARSPLYFRMRGKGKLCLYEFCLKS